MQIPSKGSKLPLLDYSEINRPAQEFVAHRTAHVYNST